MAKKKILGNCHICGLYTELTFEHVPPRAAFNDRKVIETPFEKILELDDLDNISQLKGRQSQKGSGGYTLCQSCNNNTGLWYGNAFVGWSYQGLRLSEFAKQAPSINHIYHIFPLRIIKQIVCMFFSINGPGFQKANDDLVRFVLNCNRKYMDPKIRIYTYFNLSDRLRFSGVVGNLTLGGSKNIYCEISFPPFGYIMSLDSPPPDSRLLDITQFSRYAYNDWVDIDLNIPILPVYAPFPGDYRTREQVRGEEA